MAKRDRRRILAGAFVWQWRSIPLLTDGLFDNAHGRSGEVVILA